MNTKDPLVVTMDGKVKPSINLVSQCCLYSLFHRFGYSIIRFYCLKILIQGRENNLPFTSN